MPFLDFEQFFLALFERLLPGLNELTGAASLLVAPLVFEKPLDFRYAFPA
jgi:hypothetical protein